MAELPIISFAEQINGLDWFLYDRDLRHERVKPQNPHAFFN